MSDYYVKPMTVEEKGMFLDLLSESRDQVNSLGAGASLCDQEGTWLGGMCFLSNEQGNLLEKEVAGGFIERIQGSGTWVRHWKELSSELFKSQEIFKITVQPEDLASQENIIEGLGPYDRMDLGKQGERFLFEKNYTNGFLTGENIIPRVNTSVIVTDTGTFITKTLSVILD